MRVTATAWRLSSSCSTMKSGRTLSSAMHHLTDPAPRAEADPIGNLVHGEIGIVHEMSDASTEVPVYPMWFGGRPSTILHPQHKTDSFAKLSLNVRVKVVAF